MMKPTPIAAFGPPSPRNAFSLFSHVREGRREVGPVHLLPLVCFSFILLVIPHSALAWSARGHKAVADVASEMLSSDVRSKVTAILGPNDIRHASVWPDLLRDPPQHDTEMQQFIASHPTHTAWHFINLPLRTVQYDATGPFARTNDIVQLINHCIDVLEGQSTMMSQRHALRWLVHLVGDLHQPLHVGCGYYRFDSSGTVTLVRQPAEAIGREHDRGGNALHFTNSQKLHGFWDDALVDRIDKSPGETNLLQILRSKIKPASFKTTGPIRSWSAKWAIDSVKESRGAYAGLKYGAADRQSDGDINSIIIIRPKNYAEKQENRAARQLAKGAFHLAELLNRIQWQ